MRLRRRTSRRVTALLAVALMVFAQASFAVSGCLGERTLGSSAAVDHPAGALCQLLCRAHCQAEDQTIDSPGVGLLELDQPPMVPIAPRVVAFDAGFALRVSSAIAPRTEPPPHIRFARLLN